MKTIFLKPLYARALDGLPLLGSPAEAAGRYLARPGSLVERAEEMARRHEALSASAGFLLNLGGFLTLPVTLPTNLAGVALLQLHCCAATAYLGGHDPQDKAVRDQCFACMTGTIEAGAERDEAQEVVDRSAVKLAERGLRFVAETGIGLATRAGKWAGTKVLTSRIPRRSLPVVGGVIGGASDLFSTRRVAAAARHAFLDAPQVPAVLAELESTGDGAG